MDRIRHGRGEDHSAHDPNDFEVGVRHGPVVKVLTDDAHDADCGKYAGMDRYEARKAIVADRAGGYLASIEPHKHNVGTCYRCGTTVEPMVSKQWFVKMVLWRPAIEVARRAYPVRARAFRKPYYNWMENTRDWCISRRSGGATASRPITAMTAARSAFRHAAHRVPRAASPCARTRTRWTPGFPAPGRSPRWDGGRDRGP
ncbi:MAG: class I tRNA ligase family protein [Ruthenibacterium lactatiformans]